MGRIYPVLAACAAVMVLSGCVAPRPAPAPFIPCPTPPAITEDSEGILGETGEIDEIIATLAEYASTLHGYGESNAEACVAEAGFGWRVIARDGEYYAVTADYRYTRINAEIVRGAVSATSIG